MVLDKNEKAFQQSSNLLSFLYAFGAPFLFAEGCSNACSEMLTMLIVCIHCCQACTFQPVGGATKELHVCGFGFIR